MPITREQRDAANWQAVLATARDAIVSIDDRGCITLFNPMAETMFGFGVEEVVGRNVNILMPSPYREEHDRYLRNYAETGIPKAIGKIRYVEAQRKSGEVFPIELSVSETQLDGGVVYTAIIRDVTEKLRAQAELEARVRQQAAVALLGLRALSGTSAADLMTAAVDSVAEMLAADYVKVLELLPGGTALRVAAGRGWRRGVVGGAVLPIEAGSHFEFALRSPEPIVIEDLTRETRFTPSRLLQEHSLVSGMNAIIGGLEGPYGILGAYATEQRSFSEDDANFVQAVANVLAESIARERTETALLESQRATQQRERLADIGAITAKVVHDFGNPLAALSMQTQLIIRRAKRGDFEPRDPVLQPAEQILATLRRLEVLVREFTDFARDQRLETVELDVPRFLQDVAALWRPLGAAHGVDLVVEEPAGPVLVFADVEKLRRVLDNLVKNAIDAIEEVPGRVMLCASLLSGGKVKITVEDEGSGIPEGLDVFRLFETTKPEGTGIGLAIAKQLVQAHGGTIDHRPKSPRGTIFEIQLPKTPSAAATLDTPTGGQ